MGARGSQHERSFLNSPSSLGKNKLNSNDISQSPYHRVQLTSPLTMPTSITYRCDRCGMAFPTDEALYKHRTRFCIGLTDSNIGKKLNYSDDEDMDQSTLRKIVKHQSPIDKKREEINEWKTQRSALQSVQDMEDKILRDSQKTQRLANDLKKRTHDYNQILTEYEQLQAHERDILRQMFNLQGQPGSHLNQSNGLSTHEQNQLEILQRQNARLEQERRSIQNKLEELIASDYQPTTTTMSSHEPYKLLRDMKEEQDRNENALMHLQRRFAYSNNDSLSLPYLNSHRRTPVDDIRALRNGYLHSGSRHSVDTPTHYSDLQNRLRQYEFYPWLKGHPEPLIHYRYRSIETPAEKIISTQYENQRLQKELDSMERKFEKLDSRTRQLELTLATNGMRFDSQPNGYHTYPSSTIDRYPPIRSYNNTSTRQIPTNYDNEVFDQNRQYYPSTLPSLDRRITSYVTQPITQVNPNMNKLRDPLGPKPYDPVGGFVIFFDFIINLPSTIDQCRLITCLHHLNSGLGEPSQLRPIKCELYVDEKTGERMNITLIATKQPVPNCPPEQTLSIVIEIQVTNKQSLNEVLRTNAWTKLPLFDQRNRLLSGRWKVPLKSLPINHNENFVVINSLPLYGRSEIYYRLVNFQDAADQSNAPLSPSFRDLYFYPPQYRNGSYM